MMLPPARPRHAPSGAWLLTALMTVTLMMTLAVDDASAGDSSPMKAGVRHGSRQSTRRSRVAGGPIAIAAKRTPLVETAQLHLTGEGDSTLAEIAHASGTFNAPVSAHLNLSVGHVTAIFVLHPKGGTVTGKAQARFVVKGSIAYYGGTLKITHGTGTYRRASGSNIAISGTINHLNFGLTVKANGWITY